MNRDTFIRNVRLPLKKAVLRNKRLLWRLGYAALALAGVLVLIIAMWIGTWYAGLDISKLQEPAPQPSFLYDRNGQTISRLFSGKSEPVPFEQIPLQLRNAVVAVEDRRFYEHNGVDPQAIMRALFRDVTSGSFAEGGSTITQQLAKNLFLPSDKTLSRKWREAAYALKIDSKYSKDEILGMYLNTIYYGEGAWGVQEAAKTYFGKDVRDLTLPEAALLAGLPKAPSSYSPFKHKEEALDRRNLVLSLMNEQQYISEEQYKDAISQPIVLNNGAEESPAGSYPSYVDTVLEEAETLYGFTEAELLSGGLHIYTEMDRKTQEAAQAVYADDRYFPDSKPDQLVQSGAVVLDQRSGGIRAVIGYRGEGVFRGFNHATQLRRQPGSAFKPLAVYGPALEKGYTPGSMLYDGPLDLGGYQPEDYDHRTRGQVTLLEAITQSWNIPAVWLLNEIGIDAGINFVHRLGITLPADDRKLGIALGGLSEGVSPLQMAQAYSAFANLGMMHKAHAIAKITSADGKLLVEAKPQGEQVMDPSVAYTMTLLLQSVVGSGTGQTAATNRPTAGKSGTTQLPDTDEFRGLGGNVAKDAWFVGYTPELTAAVWMGYDHTDRQHYLTTSGGSDPAMVFREMLSRALLGVPEHPFDAPKGYKLPEVKENDDHKDEPPGQRGKEKFEKPPKNDKKNHDREEHGHGKGKKD